MKVLSYGLLDGVFRFGTFEWTPGEPLTPAKGKPESVLVPGFVDIHIHGSHGHDFMSMTTAAEVEAWADSLSKIGYEYFYPTTITSDVETLKRVINTLPETHPMIPGFHLEGPFISPEYPGAQPPQFILDPETRGPEWDDILDHSQLKVVTMAGERPGALDLIQKLSRRGVRVSLGHTNATFEEAEASRKAGARHTTHTYNAMRPLHHREAGMVGFALATSEVFCELIYDRKHVCREAADVLFKAKKANKIIGISDSTMAAGMEPGQHFKMWGLDVVTGPGEVRLASNNSLAGSASTLDQVFLNMWDDFGPQLAAQACCITPRIALFGSDAPGTVWLHYSMDKELREIIRE